MLFLNLEITNILNYAGIPKTETVLSKHYGLFSLKQQVLTVYFREDVCQTPSFHNYSLSVSHSFC